MTYDELKTAFIEKCVKYSIPTAWHSFIQIPPKVHCFGTYCRTATTFDGADMLAMYRVDNVRIAVFYKDGMTDSDEAFERELEEAFRPVGRFMKNSDYDSSNGLFYSVYEFETTENL